LSRLHVWGCQGEGSELVAKVLKYNGRVLELGRVLSREVCGQIQIVNTHCGSWREAGLAE
jgi:hypothetical protein